MQSFGGGFVNLLVTAIATSGLLAAISHQA
jgi:hypothetical protein